MGELLGFIWDISVPMLLAVVFNLLVERHEMREDLKAQEKTAKDLQAQLDNADNRLDWANDEYGELEAEVKRLQAIIDHDAAPGEIDRLNAEIQRLLCNNQQLTLHLLKLSTPKFIVVNEG